MKIIRIASWTPRSIDPRKPLTGLALKLLAIGALKFGDIRRLRGI